MPTHVDCILTGLELEASATEMNFHLPLLKTALLLSVDFSLKRDILGTLGVGVGVYASALSV